MFCPPREDKKMYRLICLYSQAITFWKQFKAVQYTLFQFSHWLIVPTLAFFFSPFWYSPEFAADCQKTLKEIAPLSQGGLNEGYKTEIYDHFLVVIQVPTLGSLISAPRLFLFIFFLKKPFLKVLRSYYCCVFSI